MSLAALPWGFVNVLLKGCKSLLSCVLCLVWDLSKPGSAMQWPVQHPLLWVPHTLGHWDTVML